MSTLNTRRLMCSKPRFVYTEDDLIVMSEFANLHVVRHDNVVAEECNGAPLSD